MLRPPILRQSLLATRQVLFDFVVEELACRELEDARRIRLVRVALQNQRDTLLAFAGVLDDKLADIAQAHAIADSNSNWLFGCISLTVRVGPRRGAAVLNRSGSA